MKFNAKVYHVASREIALSVIEQHNEIVKIASIRARLQGRSIDVPAARCYLIIATWKSRLGDFYALPEK
jgi:hypothetical protein